MFSNLLFKIRTLIEDVQISIKNTCIYEGSDIFVLSGAQIVSIDEVSVNGSEINGSQYNFDSNTGKIEILVSLNEGDVIEVDYTAYNGYTNDEIKGYIQNATVFLSIFKYKDITFDFDNETFSPELSTTEENLIALISSILINPNYQVYRLPDVSITYPKRMNKIDRIEALIQHFNYGNGDFGTIDFSNGDC